MRKSTYWFITLLMILAMALVACGGNAGEEPAAEGSGEEAAADAGEEAAEEPAEEEASDDCSSPDLFCVGLVTDVGEIDDKSFNQSAWEGVERAAEELGAQVDYIETGDAKDYDANIGLFAQNGYDVIVTVGFALGEATAIAAPLST